MRRGRGFTKNERRKAGSWCKRKPICCCAFGRSASQEASATAIICRGLLRCTAVFSFQFLVELARSTAAFAQAAGVHYEPKTRARRRQHEPRNARAKFGLSTGGYRGPRGTHKGCPYIISIAASPSRHHHRGAGEVVVARQRGRRRDAPDRREEGGPPGLGRDSRLAPRRRR